MPRLSLIPLVRPGRRFISAACAWYMAFGTGVLFLAADALRPESVPDAAAVSAACATAAACACGMAHDPAVSCCCAHEGAAPRTPAETLLAAAGCAGPLSDLAAPEAPRVPLHLHAPAGACTTLIVSPGVSINAADVLVSRPGDPPEHVPLAA